MIENDRHCKLQLLGHQYYVLLFQWIISNGEAPQGAACCASRLSMHGTPPHT